MSQHSSHRYGHSAISLAKIAMAISCLFILGACSKTIDCETAASAGMHRAAQGQSKAFDPEVWDPSCEMAYVEAWEAQKAELCDANKAFDRAMQGLDRPAICDAPSYGRNFQLGANLMVLRQEKAAIEDALAAIERDGDLAAQSQSLRMRLRVLEREIPNLETLAQMRGLMEPEDLPPELRPDP